MKLHDFLLEFLTFFLLPKSGGLQNLASKGKNDKDILSVCLTIKLQSGPGSFLMPDDNPVYGMKHLLKVSSAATNTHPQSDFS